MPAADKQAGPLKARICTAGGERMSAKSNAIEVQIDTHADGKKERKDGATGAS